MEQEIIDKTEKYNRVFRLPRKIDFLLKLYNLNIKEFTALDINKYLGYDSPQPDIREIFWCLEENGVITFSSERFNIKLYKLNKKLLCKFINNLEFWKTFSEFVEYKTKGLAII